MTQIKAPRRFFMDIPERQEGSAMTPIDPRRDQTRDNKAGGKADDTNHGRGKRHGSVDTSNPEAATRRKRRAQHNKQQNQWRSKPGLCWPEPKRTDGETQ
ncbi:MAG: hypothetical protein HOM58_12805 [Rhodospirillaceae bacterium]|nr:hypothetical protein [Rhodospirillaceae bacterium]MBT5459765.1 hypothetical protein [Rhodospirillaceae bacterium]